MPKQPTPAAPVARHAEARVRDAMAEQFCQFAADDPGGFMRGLERAVIDEVQRAPWLILAG